MTREKIKARNILNDEILIDFDVKKFFIMMLFEVIICRNFEWSMCKKEKNFYKILGNLNNYFRIAKFKRKFNIENPIYLLDVFIGQSCFVQELL